jgi:hypothetical protein
MQVKLLYLGVVDYRVLSGDWKDPPRTLLLARALYEEGAYK